MNCKTYKIEEITSLTGLKRDYLNRIIGALKQELGNFVKQGCKNRKLYTEEALKIFHRAAALKKQGKTVSEIQNSFRATGAKAGSGEDCKTSEPDLQSLKSLVQSLQSTNVFLDERLSRSENRIDELLRLQAEKDRRHDTIVMQLATQVKNTQLLLEDLTRERQTETQAADRVFAEQPDQGTAEGQAMHARETLDVKGQKPAPVIDAGTQLVELEKQKIAAAAEEVKYAKHKKVKAKQPHPKRSWGIFKRLWVNMFQPELLREI